MARQIVQGITQIETVTQSGGRVSLNPRAPSGYEGLLSALESGQKIIGNIGSLTETLAKKKEDEDTAAADAFFRSKTLDEIGGMVKEGTLPADASPVFRAHVENLYGSNYLASLERTVKEKQAEGDETFKDPVKVEEWLTEQRNTFLAGKSKFTVAGFDKQYLQLRENVAAIASEARTAEAIENAAGTQSEALINTMAASVSKDEDGNEFFTPETMTRVVQDYKKSTSYLNLPPNARKTVLSNVAQELITRGDAKGLEAYLGTELDNGLTVGTVLTGSNLVKKRQMLGQAREQERARLTTTAEKFHDILYEQADRGELDLKEWERVRGKYEPYRDYGALRRLNDSRREEMQKEAIKTDFRIQFNSAVSRHTGEAKDAVTLYLKTGEIQNVPDKVVLNENGRPETLKGEDAVREQILAHPNSQDPIARMGLFASFNYEDEQAKLEIGQAHRGLMSSLNPDGQPAESTLAGLKQFADYSKVNPAYVRSLVGEEVYEELSLANDLTSKMGATPAEAAAILQGVRNSGLSSKDVSSKTMTASVDQALTEYLNPGMLSRLGTFFTGGQIEKDARLGEDAVRGVSRVRAGIRRYAAAYLYGGMAASPQEAVELAFKNAEKSGSMVKVYDKVYWAADLPQRLPKGVTPRQAMEDMAVGVEALGARLKRSIDRRDVDFVPNGKGGFTVMLRGEKGGYGQLTVDGKPYTLTAAQIEAHAKLVQQRRDRMLIEEAMPSGARTRANPGGR